MLFNSQVFVLLFLPPVLALYLAVGHRRRWREAVLVAASLFFYGYWDVRFLPVLGGLAVATWWLARIYARGGGRGCLVAGVVLNLAVLGFFKYANFFAGSAAWLAGATFEPWAILLPLGISFFVFQKISYLVDLYRGDRHVYDFLDFCVFVSFFPQLIAGPIVRHNEIIPQFATDPRGPAMWENLSRGLVLFTIGLIKKACIADVLATVCDPLFQSAAAGTALGAAEAWTAAGCYALQIYFDFSGYSDMAIGLALMFGLRLPFNFDVPYRATSIRDFWRRWHITLSRFLRDYLYIPLGGNRAGAWRQARNVVVTMLLGGLWHGAGWTFVAWGGLHGAALALNGAWARRGAAMPRGLGWALTMLFVTFCWVLFRSPDFGTAARLWGSMLGLNGVGAARLGKGAVIAAGTVAALIGPSSQAFAFGRLRPSPRLAFAVGAAIVAALLQIGGSVPNAFIYFQF